jgi:hypothetical protein
MDASHHIWHLGWLYPNRSLFNSMTDLSPAAQKVLDAYFTHADLLNREVSHEEMLAAALRVAVDLVVPDKCPPIEDFNEFDQGYAVAHIAHRADFLAIVTELESAND